MKRLALCLLACACSPAAAQEKTADARRTLYDFLVARAGHHLEARSREVANLVSPTDIKKRQERLRKEFLKSLGSFPAKSPLNSRTVGTISGDGFRVEKVFFDSRPDHQVTANLFLPVGQRAIPRRHRPVRPQFQRQGGRGVSAGLYPARTQRHRGPVL